MRARFGLDGMKQRSLEEVGRDFEISRERVRQIEARAMHKLRQPYRNYRVRDFAYGSLRGMGSRGLKTDSASVSDSTGRKGKAALRQKKVELSPVEDDAEPETLGVRSELESRADRDRQRSSTDSSEFRPSVEDLEASGEWGIDEADFEACGEWLQGGFNMEEDNILLSTLNRFEADQEPPPERRKDSAPKAASVPELKSAPSSEPESGSSNTSETLARLRNEMEHHPMSLGKRSTADAKAPSLQLA